MSMLRAPAELRHREELARLAAADRDPRPAGWRLSPRAVRRFILGDRALGIERKFYGDDPLVERCIVTLMSARGLLLVGDPGTAKSMLSELLAAAISGDSTCTVQGTSGATEDQIKYGWNYALLLAEGPSARALVPGPLHQAMQRGQLCRFEELTRVQPEIADCLIGLLSEQRMQIPELSDGPLYAAPGFNLIATANLRDRGVHEMSAALKRRFAFETVRPIADLDLEMRLIDQQTRALLRAAAIEPPLGADVIELLTTTFAELRRGQTREGLRIEAPAAVMSSAEAVAVGYAAALDAHYFDGGACHGGHIGRQLIGTVLKDQPEDVAKLRQYFERVVKPRAETDPQWRQLYAARADW
jgi:MoxR-like ATPase